jgi:hypothetical protein
MPEDVKPNRPVADRRQIRVFISSTFRDMQEEREELVKQVFPQLRRLCENRGVTWGEVDLRWGVPDEAKAEGKVLPLCLQEIEQCRPYFIGILGERYGWVPEEIPEALFETQPLLREHLHQSVTALEILHGVLRNPEMDKHAFFYFRDPAFAAVHPGFTEEDPPLRERLAKLKDDIRRSGFTHRIDEKRGAPQDGLESSRKVDCAPLRNCPNNRSDASGHGHCQTTPKRHPNRAHHYSRATSACSQSAHQSQNCQR